MKSLDPITCWINGFLDAQGFQGLSVGFQVNHSNITILHTPLFAFKLMHPTYKVYKTRHIEHCFIIIPATISMLKITHKMDVTKSLIDIINMSTDVN